MVFSELGNSQGSFSYITQSSDLDIDDATLGKLLTEAHRGQADYCGPEGVSVSQTSSVFTEQPQKCVKNVIPVTIEQETRCERTIEFLVRAWRDQDRRAFE